MKNKFVKTSERMEGSCVVISQQVSTDLILERLMKMMVKDKYGIKLQ
jgi:hypothetical protein